MAHPLPMVCGGNGQPALGKQRDARPCCAGRGRGNQGCGRGCLDTRGCPLGVRAEREGGRARPIWFGLGLCALRIDRQSEDVMV